MTACSACGTDFKASEALCDDWRDPNKSFGCPNCGTFFVKEMKSNLSGSLIGGLLCGGAITPSVLLFADSLRSGDVKTLVLSSIIGISVFIVLVAQLKATKETLALSPYRRK